MLVAAHARQMSPMARLIRNVAAALEPGSKRTPFVTVPVCGEFPAKRNCMSQVLIDIPEPRQSAKQQDYPNTYVPIPPNGKACPITGLKHAQLYKMLTNGGPARTFVRVVSLKAPGASKGKTIFHVGDLLRYLDWLAKGQGSGAERIADGKEQ